MNDSPPTNPWARRIWDLRQKADLNLSEIGEKIGMSVSGVSDIVNGRTAEPRGDAAVALDKLHRELCPSEAA